MPFQREPDSKTRAVTLDSPLEPLRGFGPATADRFARAGFATVSDLLCHLPARFEDRRFATPAAAVSAPGVVTLIGALVDVRVLRSRGRRRPLVRAAIEDASGRLPVLWYNQPFLASRILPGQLYRLHGEVRQTRRERQLLNPSCEPWAAGAEVGEEEGPIAVYPGAGGIGPAALRRAVERALAALDWTALVDPLPADLRARHGLPELGPSLLALHRGPDALPRARERLVYGELLALELELRRRRERRRSATKAHAYGDLARIEERAERALPFELTAAQRRALAEIRADLAAARPMARLLQGDVGSGKTAVAALAMAMAAESGLQAVLMAPTELLAEQHARNLARLLGERWPVGLLTGSAGDARELRRALAAGEQALAVGTHALLEPDVVLPRLALAVIDEQQRFGVEQRERLAAKAGQADTLVTTATPIPRSLALTRYGELDLSLLDELPPGRAPVSTELLPRSRARGLYHELAAGLGEGEQIYVVFPRIEEAGRSGGQSLAGREAELRRCLAPHSVEILHGRMSAREREQVVARLLSGELRVLLATTVIEVGLDVPAATVMVIEGAERLGLAQLHQLRGRIGRGGRPGRCIALHGRLTPEARQRLEQFAALADGFALAEADLLLRGAGDLLGTQQSGDRVLKVADLARDLDWLEKARADAHAMPASPAP